MPQRLRIDRDGQSYRSWRANAKVAEGQLNIPDFLVCDCYIVHWANLAYLSAAGLACAQRQKA